jgi:hypothetical protein
MDLSVTESYVFTDIVSRLLRGGPSFRLRPYWMNTVVYNTNKSNRVIFTLTQSSTLSNNGESHLFTLQPAVSFRIGNHVFMSGNFRYTGNTDNFQYVTQKPAGNEIRYVLAEINQKTYSVTFRLNYNITPDISIQYYGSPFVSSGKYSEFKKATDTQAKVAEERYHTFSDSEITYNEVSAAYTVTDGTATYSFSNPDFSFRELRSNLVARWEYRPGSTLYLVWAHNRNSRQSQYIPSYGDNLNELFGSMPTNVFMVKMSFWLGM